VPGWIFSGKLQPGSRDHRSTLIDDRAVDASGRRQRWLRALPKHNDVQLSATNARTRTMIPDLNWSDMND